jgi:putative oxygen-independent coproporphyrinogen III oxidase
MASLGIYVQVPFCSSKCSFCNFSSQVAPERVFDDYCRALAGEIETLSEPADFAGCRPDTLYFGGGTPTLMGAERLNFVLSALRRRFPLDDLAEFTIEVTPGSADNTTLAALVAAGVDRLSIGAQSFDDHELRSVGRLHTAQATDDLVRRARRAGIRSVSLDLIAGLPHQTETSWRRSLERALVLDVDHLSIYLYEIDEKSRLGAEVLRHGDRYHAEAVPGEEFQVAAYEEARERLAAAGYIQYEISNFARPGHESIHNRKYWRLEPYLGLGAGAHSFDGEQRWANESSPEVYAANLARGESPIAERRQLSIVEQIEEFFFLGLRQREGVCLGYARNRWGDALLARWRPRIDALVRDRLLESGDGWVRLTPSAYAISNEVFREFLWDEDDDEEAAAVVQPVSPALG